MQQPEPPATHNEHHHHRSDPAAGPKSPPRGSDLCTYHQPRPSGSAGPHVRDQGSYSHSRSGVSYPSRPPAPPRPHHHRRRQLKARCRTHAPGAEPRASPQPAPETPEIAQRTPPASQATVEAAAAGTAERAHAEAHEGRPEHAKPPQTADQQAGGRYHRMARSLKDYNSSQQPTPLPPQHGRAPNRPAQPRSSPRVEGQQPRHDEQRLFPSF